MEYRIEHDVLGEVNVPKDACWMSQTQRSLENFKIGTEKMPPVLIDAFAYLKMACAIVNEKEHKITCEQKDAILEVGKMIVDRKLADQFPLAIWQTGSGTQTNMNVNEVITHVANVKANKNLLHPNDSVNCSQSSNDTFPSALHIMTAIEAKTLLIPAIEECIETLKQLEEVNRGIIKIGRTHLQDATPLYVSDELSGWRSMLEHSIEHIRAALPAICELAIGATAVGSGLNAPENYGPNVCAVLSDMTGIDFVSDPNFFHALTSKDACAFFSGALKGFSRKCDENC